ncbi:MAG TPA: exosortase A, partial [Arenibaculum sp.]|nr:exosortase A [Arenibaculum sp.]
MLAAAIGMLVLFRADTVTTMAAVWRSSAAYGHGFLVAPISMALIVLRWPRIRHLPARPSATGLALALLFALAHSAGEATGTQTLATAALVAQIPAAFLAVLGRRIVRELAFPLGFLAFMIPIGDFLIAPLQQAMMAVIEVALTTAGIPHFVDGIRLSTPTGEFMINETCAGLRYLISTIVPSSLFAHFALRSRRRRTVFMVLAVAVPILANGLRGIVVVMVDYHLGGGSAIAADHALYGWALHGAVFAMLLAIG